MCPQPHGVAEASTTAHRDADRVWALARAAAAHAERQSARDQPGVFGLADGIDLRPLPAGHEHALIAWRPGTGWESTLPRRDPRRALLDLYLPVCSATRARPITIGHLGQSLDGFIATRTGDSQFVTGEENILHLHRLRALSDAIIVGAGTVVADDPQLNTRHVSGPSPLRVVLDPTRRLSAEQRVFSDGQAPTLYACARSLVREGETRFGDATVVGLDLGPSGVDLGELLRHLRAQECARVFVEGGGVTVSAFLEAGLLDRLHVAVAPFLIGDGRPAIRLPGPAALRDCLRPRHRVFRMGSDILFDCDLTSPGPGPEPEPLDEPAVSRII